MFSNPTHLRFPLTINWELTRLNDDKTPRFRGSGINSFGGSRFAASLSKGKQVDPDMYAITVGFAWVTDTPHYFNADFVRSK